MTETFTPGHSLSKFEDGDNPGATKLNANWTKIDKHLPKTGTSFPASYPVDGLFLRTDELTLYQNTGTLNTPVWTEVLGATPGPQGDPGPAGADGADGDQGPEGDQGPAGAAGADGESFLTFDWNFPELISTAENNRIQRWIHKGATITLNRFGNYAVVMPQGGDVTIVWKRKRAGLTVEIATLVFDSDGADYQETDDYEVELEDGDVIWCEITTIAGFTGGESFSMKSYYEEE